MYGLYVFGELAHRRTGAADLRRLADLVADRGTSIPRST